MTETTVVYRPSAYIRKSEVQPLLPETKRYPAPTVSARPWYTTLAWVGAVTLLLMAITTAAAMGWIRAFQDDNVYAGRFAELAAENDAIQQSLDTEAAVRAAADDALIARQLILSDAVTLEETTRISQDIYLNQLLVAEIAAREAAQALLNALLLAEITARESADGTTAYALDDIEARLLVMQAYDIFALQQFMIKMDNFTHMSQRLAVNIAARMASDAALSAQDNAQVAAIALLSAQLAAEIATRMAADAAQMAAIAPFLNGVYRINGQNGVANAFDLVSNSCSVVVGTSGGNVVTLSGGGLLTFGNQAPHTSTRDMAIYAGVNTVISSNPGANQMTIALIALPIPANVQSYTGAWSGGEFIPPDIWTFDAGSGLFATFGSTYNGLAWEIPNDAFTGFPAGNFIVRIKMSLTFSGLGTRALLQLVYGTCIGTHVTCVTTPTTNLVTNKAYSSPIVDLLAPAQLAFYGILYQDVVMETTLPINALAYPATTGVYPVWKNTGNTVLRVVAIAIEYQVTRIH